MSVLSCQHYYRTVCTIPSMGKCTHAVQMFRAGALAIPPTSWRPPTLVEVAVLVLVLVLVVLKEGTTTILLSGRDIDRQAQVRDRLNMVALFVLCSIIYYFRVLLLPPEM